MKLIDSIAYSDIKYAHKVFLKTEDYTIHLYALKRGQEIPKHNSDKNAFITVLDGNAKVLINDEENILGVNDSLLLPKDFPHSLHAIENFKMMLIK